MRIAGRVVTDYVAQHYGLTFTQILSENRRWQIARPRQVAMYVMREVCPHLSYPAIGRLLGGRDHTTILHGVQRIEALMVTDGDLLDSVLSILRHFRSCGAATDMMLEVRIDAASKYLNALIAERNDAFQRSLMAA